MSQPLPKLDLFPLKFDLIVKSPFPNSNNSQLSFGSLLIFTITLDGGYP